MTLEESVQHVVMTAIQEVSEPLAYPPWFSLLCSNPLVMTNSQSEEIRTRRRLKRVPETLLRYFKKYIKYFVGTHRTGKALIVGEK